MCSDFNVSIRNFTFDYVCIQTWIFGQLCFTRGHLWIHLRGINHYCVLTGQKAAWPEGSEVKSLKYHYCHRVFIDSRDIFERHIKTSFLRSDC